MNYDKNTTRPITNDEQRVVAFIEESLGDSPAEKMLYYVQIKCATEEGFFGRLMDAVFAGYQSQNSELVRSCSKLSSALLAAERNIPKSKKKQKGFLYFRNILFNGFMIARNWVNCDDKVEEYRNDCKEL